MTFTEVIELKDQDYMHGTPILLLSTANFGVIAAVGKDLANSDYELYYATTYPIHHTIIDNCLRNPDTKYVIILDELDGLSKDKFKEAYSIATTRINNGQKIPDNVELCARIARFNLDLCKYFDTERDLNEFYSKFMVIRPNVEPRGNHKFRIGFRL